MPFIVGFVVVRFGWRYAFLTTGLFSRLWLIIWLKVVFTRRNRIRTSRGKSWTYINGDPAESATKIVWSHLIPHRQTWAFLCGKLLTDPIWWFYLFWLPGYLFNRYGLSITKMGLPLLIIYNVCTDRQRLWRLAAHEVHQHGLEPEPRAQDCDANLRDAALRPSCSSATPRISGWQSG
jgi:hypothetical protein